MLDDCKCIEQVTVQLMFQNRSVYISCVYIRPNTGASTYAIYANGMKQLCQKATVCDSVVVLGDYNLPNLDWQPDEDVYSYIPMNASTEAELTLTESLLSDGLNQILNLTNRNGVMLDLAFVSDVHDWDLFEPPVPLTKADSHHKPFLLSTDIYLENDRLCNSEILDFDFRRCDFERINNAIHSINWVNLLVHHETDEAVHVFYECLLNIFVEHVPQRKRIYRSRYNQPWWNSELRSTRNRLRKIRKRYWQLRTTENKQKLRETETLYNHLQSEAFREYIENIESKVKTDPSSFWSFIKSRKPSERIPMKMELYGKPAKSTQESADMFAEFFTSVHSREPAPHDERYLSRITNQDLNLPPLTISTADVSRSLNLIDTSKGPGPDGLPPLLLKQCSDSLALPVAVIFNKSLASGNFPDEWKKASITPVHKNGNSHKIENYRPISILNCLAKVFESTVHEMIYPAISHVITDSQHGFVKKRSTTTNLMNFVSEVVNRLEKRQQVDTIYIDFSKAFDKVPHTLTIEKLHRMGFPDWIINWLRSYLTCRQAFVKLHTAQSTWFDLPSGVPQGSILGPLLFALFVNDLDQYIKCDKAFYADDLKFFRTIVSHMDCYLIQADIDTLLKWCSANGMEVNVVKCKSISYSRLHQNVEFEYRMNDIVLEKVDKIRDLGVIIDKKMTFNNHIAATTAKAYSLLGFLKRNTWDFQDVYALKTLYCSIVRSVLEYAVPVWAPYHEVQKERIERIQRLFVRYALRRLPWGNPLQLPSYQSRCKLINIQTLDHRRNLLRRMFIFNLLNYHVDCSQLLARVRFTVPLRRLRNTPRLFISLRRTVYGQNEPFESCCRVFNDVYHLFDFNLSRLSFKNKIKNIS